MTSKFMDSYYQADNPFGGLICKLTGAGCADNCRKCVFAAVAWAKELDRMEEEE